MIIISVAIGYAIAKSAFWRRIFAAMLADTSKDRLIPWNISRIAFRTFP
jgi:hypothetical protein